LKRLPGNRVEVIIEDSGSGFDSGKLGASRIDGVGFGLFNIQERLKDLGGNLQIESRPPQGTRARITAPISAEETAEFARLHDAQEADVSTHQLSPQGASCRVLIVDDHPIVRKGLINLLETEDGIEVVGQVGDSTAAIQAVERLAPDIVLMDVNLGEMDGIEATRRILTVRADTEVIGLSMYTDETVAKAMLDAGAAAYLKKLGAPEELIETIRVCAQQRARRTD
jgi:CheY-like chemotaxis protein